MDFKQRIVEAAYQLFTEKGFEKTSVSDIIKLAGGSIGGFYHHFKSKDEVLNSVIFNSFDGIIDNYNRLLQDENVTAIQLFNSVFLSICDYKSSQVDEWAKIGKILSYSGSHEYLRKMANQFEETTTHLYTKIIYKGIKEGVFSVKHPSLLANMWTREIIHIFDVLRKMLVDEKECDTTTFAEMLDFNEEIFSYALGLKNYKLRIKQIVLDYFNNVKNQLINKSEDTL